MLSATGWTHDATPSPDSPDGPGKRFVDERFTDYATSGLEFRVPEQTDWKITVEPPKAAR
jgi:hypothetical protein